MRVVIGTDHGGYEEKERLKQELQGAGYDVEDVGAFEPNTTDDYPEFAIKVGRAVQSDPAARGILLCRSGEGMAMTVNKLKGIRAALAWRPDVAVETRRDNDSNVLVLPSDFVSPLDMLHTAKNFLETEFSHEERHVRRLDAIKDLENES